MSQTISAFTLAALVAAVTALSTQTVPSFAGKWSLVSDANAPGASGGALPAKGLGNMGSGWGSDITISQDAATLTIEYDRFPERDLQPPVRLAYRLDGSESRNTLLMGRGVQEQVATASWKDEQIVITTTHRVASAGAREVTSETVQVLSLETPTSLVVETTRSAVMGGRSSTTRAVYTRK